MTTNRSSPSGAWRAAAVLLGLAIGMSLTGMAAAAEEQTQKPEEDQPAVIDWLRSKEGGYFSDAVVFREGGMFAVRDIPAGELVMVVPPDALLGPGEGDKKHSFCATARRLVREYLLGESSTHWPYVQYVFEAFPHASVPIGWSKEGKQLVRDIVGEELDPQGFGKGSYAKRCGKGKSESGKEQRTLLEAAYRIVVSRGWEQIMVPVFDMVNHRNGKWQNVDRDPSNGANLKVDGDFRIVALKPIKKGSQLHNSYNQCHDVTCHGIAESYLTPEIFSDYGFVEQYPRRFGFEVDEDWIVMEIDEGDKVTWIRGDDPSPDELEQLKPEWKRLTAMAQSVADRAKVLQYEGKAALEYYEALTGALELALGSASRQEHGGDGADEL